MSTFSNAPRKKKKGRKTSWAAHHGVWVRETGQGQQNLASAQAPKDLVHQEPLSRLFQMLEEPPC
jgi:hypothetical protein